MAYWAVDRMEGPGRRSAASRIPNTPHTVWTGPGSASFSADGQRNGTDLITMKPAEILL